MAALEQLYRRYYRRVRWVLRGNGVAESALDDRVHDVFLAIHRRLPQRDPSIPMRQWITGVTRNVAFSHRRTMARQRRQLEQLASPADPPQPDEQLARRQAWQALSGFLEQLSPEQREVFVMVDITGMRVSELAATTGEPANTLHSRLRVARVRFGRHFEAGDDARSDMLRRARRQAAPAEGQQRRTWAGIVVAAGGPEALAPLAAPGSTGASTTAVSGWVSTTAGKIGLAAGAASILVAAAIGGSGLRKPSAAPSTTPSASASAPASVGPPSARPVNPRTSSPPAESDRSVPSPVEDITIQPPPSRASAARRTVASSTEVAPPPAPVDPDAGMAAALLTLRRARGHLTEGHSADALAELDRFEGDFGELERERLRLLLEASCAAAESTRARTAARALVARGVALDPEAPCTPRDDRSVD